MNKMTMFEKRIHEYIEKHNGKKSAKDIANGLNLKEYSDGSGASTIGMTIGRMIKKGVPIEYNYSGYRVVTQ